MKDVRNCVEHVLLCDVGLKFSVRFKLFALLFMPPCFRGQKVPFCGVFDKSRFRLFAVFHGCCDIALIFALTSKNYERKSKNVKQNESYEIECQTERKL